MNTPDNQAVEVVITAPNSEWLREFVDRLVQQHLCSAGLLSHHETIYYWEGEVHRGHEAKAILYTRESLVPTITEKTRQGHPYKVPHISATQICGGNLDYLQWIIAETTGHTSTL